MASKKAPKKRPYEVKWEDSKHPLAVALRKKGVSQRQLATMAGVQAADISRVLTGEHKRFAAGTAARLYPVVKPWKIRMEDLILAHGA